MTSDRVTATVHDAEKHARAHGPENDGDHHERANTARESDFTSAGDMPHNDPIMAALNQVLRGERS